MRPRHIWLALTLTIVMGLSAPAHSEDPGFKVIVNPKNPVSTIERELLRNAFLKKEGVWKGGEAMRPIGLSSKQPVRTRFIQVVLKKTPAQLKTYWAQQIFSGKGVPPPEVATPADVIAYVLANPGAVGYLPADVDPRSAKVIEVR